MRRWQGEALAVLQSAATAVDGLTDAPEIAAVVREVLLSSSGDDEALTAAVTRLAGALSAALDEVNRAKQELERLAAERVEPFSEEWWARLRRDAESGTAVQAARDWVVAYVQALLAGRPDVLQRLCDPSLGTRGRARPGRLGTDRCGRARRGLAGRRRPGRTDHPRRCVGGRAHHRRPGRPGGAARARDDPVRRADHGGAGPARAGRRLGREVRVPRAREPAGRGAGRVRARRRRHRDRPRRVRACRRDRSGRAGRSARSGHAGGAGGPVVEGDAALRPGGSGRRTGRLRARASPRPDHRELLLAPVPAAVPRPRPCEGRARRPRPRLGARHGGQGAAPGTPCLRRQGAPAGTPEATGGGGSRVLRRR